MGAIVLLLNPFRKSVYGKNISQQGWDVKYIPGLKGYEKTDTVPVVVIEEEKKKCTKQGT